jgi:hypothetical protein
MHLHHQPDSGESLIVERAEKLRVDPKNIFADRLTVRMFSLRL